MKIFSHTHLFSLLQSAQIIMHDVGKIIVKFSIMEVFHFVEEYNLQRLFDKEKINDHRID